MRAGRLAAALAAAALSLPAPPAAAAPRPRPGGELRVLLAAPPGELDPARAASAPDLVVARALHATLYDLDASGAPVPALAEALPEPSADGRELRIRLKPGLRFQDGAPVTAADVVESLSRLLRPEVGSPHGWIAAAIEGAEAVREGRARTPSGLAALSDQELRVSLAVPFPGLARALAAPPAAVLHGPGPIFSGAGPFRLVARTADALRLAPFEGHHRGRPWADAAVISWPDAAAAARRLARAEAELALRPEAVGGLTSRETPLVTEAVALVNARRLGAAAAEAVRGALRALDAAELSRLLRGPGRPLPSLLPAGAAAPPAHAGSAVPARLVLLAPASLRPLADRIQVKLFDRGVRVAVEAVPDAALAARQAAGGQDVALVPVTLASADPALALAQLVAALGGPGRGLRAARELAAADGAALAAAAARAEEELHAVPLAAQPLRETARPGLEGLAAAGASDLGDLWLLGDRRRRP